MELQISRLELNSKSAYIVLILWLRRECVWILDFVKSTYQEVFVLAIRDIGGWGYLKFSRAFSENTYSNK